MFPTKDQQIKGLRIRCELRGAKIRELQDKVIDLLSLVAEKEKHERQLKRFIGYSEELVEVIRLVDKRPKPAGMTVSPDRMDHVRAALYKLYLYVKAEETDAAGDQVDEKV